MLIFDSYALLCLFDKKHPSGQNKIKQYLSDAEKGRIKLYMSKINEGEVFYRLYKYLGEPVAAGFREDIKSGVVPITVISVNDKRAERASEIKAKHAVAYADAFCIELALDMGLPIVTGDPEFKSVRQLVTIEWLAAR